MDNSLPGSSVQSSKFKVQSSVQGNGTMPQVQPADDTTQPVSQPVGSVAKEHGPSVGVSEFIKPSGAEASPVIPPEVAEHGVEAVVNEEAPRVTEEQRQVGIEPAKESVPVLTQPTGLVQGPMTEEEARETMKIHKKVSNSIVWLAATILKHAQMVHQKITG